MRTTTFKTIVVLCLSLAATVMHAQNALIVKPTTGVKTPYAISEFRKITFPAGSTVKVTKTDATATDYVMTDQTMIIKTIPIWQGTGGTTDWNTATNWNPTSAVPAATDDVLILGTGSRKPKVNAGTTAVCNDLYINPGAADTIAAGGLLTVKGEITNKTGVTGLIIKAGSTDALPNGSFVFTKTQSVNPQATVEMYCKATTNTAAGVNQKMKWQFVGIPVQSTTAATFADAYIRRYDETTPTSRWNLLLQADGMTPGTGYEIAPIANRSVSKNYPITGTLVNGDKTITLTKTITSVDGFQGMNLVANPFTAAISIGGITFGSGVTQTVYIYNTGTMAEWTTNSTVPESSTATTAGQYLAMPKSGSTAVGVYATIPSMQAFVVKTTVNNATITLPYSAVVKNDRAQRAPAQPGIFTRIDLAAGNTPADRLYLLSDPTCTRTFDDGMDGEKTFASALVPQLYAMEPDDNYWIDAIADVNNTELGFRPGTGTHYTLTFTHSRLQEKYDALYLQDLVAGTFTDISADGSTYSFTATATQPEKRFRLLSSAPAPAALSTVADHTGTLKVFSTGGNTVFVHNTGNQTGELSIYDIAGKLVSNFSYGANTISSKKLSLTAGAYIAKAGKITAKIIIK